MHENSVSALREQALAVTRTWCVLLWAAQADLVDMRQAIMLMEEIGHSVLRASRPRRMRNNWPSY
jgi:hypothetical protein